MMGREGGRGKAFFKQCLHSPTDVEFTFNYQMIPHYPFRHFLMPDSVLHTLNIYGLQSITPYKLSEGKPTRMRRLCLKTSEAEGRGGWDITSSSEEVYELINALTLPPFRI